MQNAELLRKIMMVSSILIAGGLFGCSIVMNVARFRTPLLVGIFALITCTGCIGMILYSTIYVIQKLREDKRK